MLPAKLTRPVTRWTNRGVPATDETMPARDLYRTPAPNAPSWTDEELFDLVEKMEYIEQDSHAKYRMFKGKMQRMRWRLAGPHVEYEVEAPTLREALLEFTKL